MPIYCNYFDINLYQGQSFFLDLFYADDSNTPIDLNGNTYEASMQVRRSPLVDQKLLSLSSNNYPNGVIGGGATGFFVGSSGRIGTGGISLNYGGETGALRLEIDYITTSYIPAGRHFYDVDVKNKETNFVDKVVTGTFEVTGEVTRSADITILEEDSGGASGEPIDDDTGAEEEDDGGTGVGTGSTSTSTITARNAQYGVPEQNSENEIDLNVASDDEGNQPDPYRY